jgi:exopolysaccharide biosynthesis polyprenyl glycosylphosphotransferase
MFRKYEKYSILLDFFTINAAWVIYYLVRIESRWISYGLKPDFLLPMLVVYVYWLLIFIFFGLYRQWHAGSRLDEFTVVFKAIMLGCLILFFAIFIDDEGYQEETIARSLILLYWGILLLSVGLSRAILRTARRHLLERGIGLRNAIIVGWNAKGKELFMQVSQFPALGYRVIGFVTLDKRRGKANRELHLLGHIDDLSTIIDTNSIEDVLIALESKDHNQLLDVISRCNGHDVSMKIMPDMYDIISGQARTNQLYGVPLIEIMPRIMQPWEESMKRVMDIVSSVIVLILTAPLWLVIGVAIKLETKGPVVYSQERVGKNGKIFRMHKFRSMYSDAERDSGPVWAPKDDNRVTRVGRFLRNARLDEIPQFLNVFSGEMSLVGPRPERPYFVEKLAREIPLYMRRLRVRPGITGWAQIKQGYDRTIDDVRSKVRYDLFYIENMSLRMDLKILLFTVYVMMSGKGH